MAAPRTKTHYEVYVTQQDRFELHDVSEDREVALATARRLAARPDTLVRVMREVYDPDRDETVERIIFDSAVALPEASPAPRSGHGPSVNEDRERARRPLPEPEGGVPALVVVFGGLSLAAVLAAATAAVF